MKMIYLNQLLKLQNQLKQSLKLMKEQFVTTQLVIILSVCINSGTKQRKRISEQLTLCYRMEIWHFKFFKFAQNYMNDKTFEKINIEIEISV